ncbi:hypothetical protein Tco_1421959 [Tanacetum coccineum]
MAVSQPTQTTPFVANQTRHPCGGDGAVDGGGGAWCRDGDEGGGGDGKIAWAASEMILLMEGGVELG